VTTRPLSRGELRALRALHHCGVIRLRFDDPGFIGLYEAELAECKPVDGDEDVLDYRLNSAGRRTALEVLR
jgi:hypothetical protein